jgi:spore germination cell wall hydrolase CwlJ-like protein
MAQIDERYARQQPMGRRETVQDPLAKTAGQNAPVRDLGLMAVKNPMSTSGMTDQSKGISDAVNSLNTAISGVLASKQEDWTTEGKLSFMQGKTEDEIAQSGNKYTMQGWQTMSAVDKAQRWYADEVNNIDNGAKTLDPVEYNKQLMQKRAGMLKDLPDDPAVRKVYVAAFDDLGPRLTVAHTRAHNAYNQEQSETAFTGMLQSTGYTSQDTPQQSGRSPLAMSPTKVRPTVQFSDADIDAATRTVLGEAGGEGAMGQSAVAHVLLNRTISGNYGGNTISAVVNHPQQFTSNSPDNKLFNADKNSVAYQQARQVVMDTFSGNVVDPTNGATHFVSGGIRPDWFGEQEQASGGVVKIGGHEFVGKANNLGNAASPTSGRVKFSRDEEANIQVPLANALANTGKQLGIDINVNSGNRGPDGSNRNAAVGGAKHSEHNHGNAVDIDMSGMNDAKRQDLVRGLKANGVTRFITYDKSPDMLHVDMGKPVDDTYGGYWYMHNKTNAQLGNAPKWFQEVTKEPAPAGGTNIAATNASNPKLVQNAAGLSDSGVGGGPDSGSDNAGGVTQTSMQSRIRSVAMPNDRKAALLAQSMMTQFNAGQSSIFDSAGGIGILRELGAPENVVRQVQNAKDGYDRQQRDKFSLEDAKWSAGLKQRITSNELTLDAAHKEIQDRYDSKKLSDASAKSLVAETMQIESAKDKQINMDPEYQRGIANIYAAVRKDPNTYSAEWADAEVRKLSAQHKVPTSQVTNILSQVWSTETSAKAAIEKEVARVAEETKVRNETVTKVQSALAQGRGLNNVTGDIDGKPAKEWAMEQYKASLIKGEAQNIDGYMKNGLSQEEAMRKADADANSKFWRMMQQQGGLVYQKDADNLTAAVSGNIVDSSGKVSKQAVEGLDMWMRLKDVDPTGTYGGQYAKTNEAKNLLMNAERFVSIGFDAEPALRKAHEFVGKGLTEQPDISKMKNFQEALKTGLGESFNNVFNTGTWIGDGLRAVGLMETFVDKDRVNRVLGLTTGASDAKTKDGAKVENTLAHSQLVSAITARSQAIFQAEPGNDPNVIIKKASQDVLKNSEIVGNSVLIGRNAQENITADMGMQRYPKGSVNKAVQDQVNTIALSAIKEYITKGTDPDGWGLAFKNAIPKRDFEYISSAYTSELPKFDFAKRIAENYKLQDVQFHSTYDPTTKNLTVQLMNADGTALVDAKPFNINARALGADYRTKRTAEDRAGIVDKFLNSWPDSGPEPTTGLTTKGNIDLSNRPRVKNGDGSISTIRSMSFEEDGKEVLIPTVVNGKVVSAKEAIDHYRETGEFLGKFKTPDDATAYGQWLHKEEAAKIKDYLGFTTKW